MKENLTVVIMKKFNVSIIIIQNSSFFITTVRVKNKVRVKILEKKNFFVPKFVSSVPFLLHGSSGRPFQPSLSTIWEHIFSPSDKGTYTGRAIIFIVVKSAIVVSYTNFYVTV